MRASEFEARLRELQRGSAAVRDNRGCFECERCERSLSCTFCRDSKGLVRCHHCEACVDCTDCSHGRKCVGCVACHHCVASERCQQSAYLVRCTGLIACTYCFGCVGLSSKDYHLLNEPYDRRTYFEITARLSKEIGIG